MSEAAELSAPRVNRAREALRVLGTTVTQVPALKRAAEEDLGRNIEFITLDGTEAQRRGALHPESFDVYDQWFHDIDLIWPTGSIQPIDTRRIERWSEVDQLPRTGRLHSDRAPARGAEPSARLFVQLDGSLGRNPTNSISMVPTVHNGDSFVVVGADPGRFSSWGCLLDPDWSGRVMLQADAAIGVFDMLLALRASGEMMAGDSGDLTIEEIDRLTELVRRYRAEGHFRAFWVDDAQAMEAARRDLPVIGSLWWSSLVKMRAEGIGAQLVTPDEGYRGWFGGLGLSRQAEPWAVDAAYDYFNWWLAGRAGALMTRNGAYMTARSAVRAHMTDAEWGFWYEGEPAATGIRDADGVEIFNAGERREGGSYEERMSRICIWNTIMVEHNYLVRRWESALFH